MIVKFLGIFLSRPYRKQLKAFVCLARNYGQLRSMKLGGAVSADGVPLPWYTYPAIEYLGGIDFSKCSVFEYGSGNSSSFWASRATLVCSVEGDEEWYEHVLREKSENQRLYYAKTKEDYIESIAKEGMEFDVIVVDGDFRKECAEFSVDYLAKAGVIILDNSDWYKQEANYLREGLNLIQVDFHGFGPINDYTWTTSIFISRTARLQPLGGALPVTSIGGLTRDTK